MTRLAQNEQVVLVWNELADAIMRGVLHIAIEAAGVSQTKVVFAFYYQGVWPVRFLLFYQVDLLFICMPLTAKN